jgi:hypothetical protein
MLMDVTQLSEVVVTGYGFSERRSLSASVSSLQGRVAGVAIDEAMKKLKIRKPSRSKAKRRLERLNKGSIRNFLI